MLHTWEVSGYPYTVWHRPKSKLCHRLADILSMSPAVNYCYGKHQGKRAFCLQICIVLHVFIAVSQAYLHICGNMAISIEILTQPLLPMLAVLIRLSAEIVSLRRAEKLAACLQHSYHAFPWASFSSLLIRGRHIESISWFIYTLSLGCEWLVSAPVN